MKVRLILKASELTTGIKVEAEHKDVIQFIKEYYKKHDKFPSNKEIQKRIAAGHIKEDKKYYTKLMGRLEDFKPKGDEKKIVKFFKDNPYPCDDKVHAFAEKIKMNPHKLESKIYGILSQLIIGE